MMCQGLEYTSNQSRNIAGNAVHGYSSHSVFSVRKWMRPFNWSWEHKAFLASWAGRLHRRTPWPVSGHWDICRIFSDPLYYLTSRITDIKSLPDIYILQLEVVVWQRLQIVVFTDFFPFTLLDKNNRRWKKGKKVIIFVAVISTNSMVSLSCDEI